MDCSQGIVANLKCLSIILNTIPSNLFSYAEKHSRPRMEDVMEHLPEEQLTMLEEAYVAKKTRHVQIMEDIIVRIPTKSER